jgi:hypothetical protein
MNEHTIRQELHAILDSHADMLLAIRTAHTAMRNAFDGHDAALVSAIEANQRALKLLNRLMDEGVDADADTDEGP